jgi:hypothetical protein
MIRSFYLVLLLLFAFYSTWAQPYLRLPANGGHWKMAESHANGSISSTWSFFRETAGDTLYHGYTATRIPTTALYIPPMSFVPYPNFHTRYIHQDSNGRAYEVDSLGQLNMLYDLSVSVGDTLNLQDERGFPLDYRVDSIDTVTYADNIPRKRIFLYCNQMFGIPIWVEGIGDVAKGPFPVLEFENNQDMVCYAENGLLLAAGPQFPSTTVADCFLLVGTPEPAAALTISPNPARDQLKLTLADAQPLHVRLLALDGRVLGTWVLDGAAAHTLQLPAAPAGLYLLELRNSEGRRQTQRLVLE